MYFWLFYHYLILILRRSNSKCIWHHQVIFSAISAIYLLEKSSFMASGFLSGNIKRRLEQTKHFYQWFNYPWLLTEKKDFTSLEFRIYTHIWLFLNGHCDAQTHDSANIAFLHDFHIFYILYEKMNFWKNYVVQK